MKALMSFMKRVLVMVLVVISFSASSQNFEKKFYDADGKAVDEENSTYYSFTKEVYNDVDTIKSYYTKNGSIRSIEVVKENGLRNGLAILYHDNGGVKAKANYEQGSISGEARSWYADGSPQSVEFFLPMQEGGLFGNSTLSDYWDPKGNRIVTNGKGYCECLLNIFSNPKVTEAGKVLDGVRDSVWVGYRMDGTKYYEEIYAAGELRTGFSFDKTGVQYSYDRVAEMASPQGGMQGLGEHLMHAVTYPKSARRRGIEGKVYVEFVVDKGGEVTNITVIKGIGYECDQEAVNAMKTCPRWSPARQRGQPVKVKMVLPISFNLGQFRLT
jgi:TonB family protein